MMIAPLLLSCAQGPLPDANDAQALAAIRACEVRTPWWFGPAFGFDIEQGVAIRLRGLRGRAFETAAQCLRGSLRGQGVGALVEEADRPEPPVQLIEVGSGNVVTVPPRQAPEPDWRDMDGRRIPANEVIPPAPLP